MPYVVIHVIINIHIVKKCRYTNYIDIELTASDLPRATLASCRNGQGLKIPNGVMKTVDGSILLIFG